MGLKITVDQGRVEPLTEILVFVPAKVGEPIDVADRLQESAEIIFNERLLSVGTPKDRLFTLNLANRKSVTVGHCSPVVLPEGGPTWDAIRVELMPSIPPGNTRYLRFRLPLLDATRLARRYGFLRRMAIYDVRFYERRQRSLESGLRNQLSNRTLLGVRRVQHFLIVPAAGLLSEFAPTLKYTRMLEENEWQAYLGERLRRSIVYYWDSQDVQKAPAKKNGGQQSAQVGSGQAQNATNTAAQDQGFVLDEGTDFRVYAKIRPLLRPSELLGITGLVLLAAYLTMNHPAIPWGVVPASVATVLGFFFMRWDLSLAIGVVSLVVGLLAFPRFKKRLANALTAAWSRVRGS